jgi:hypothetical protein
VEKRVVKSIPIKFEQIQEIDDRFRRYKIWVVNVGKNYNGSIFTKEAIEKAIPSIVNTPVLGFIKENRLGEKDFAGHEFELIVKNGELKEKYLGSAYGVIPQDCNPKFELRENEFGGLEEYLTVECIMWTKFDDAIEIMDRDGTKFQSMELHDDYSGYWNDEGYFVFEDFKFFGCCILGGDALPAIPQSTIERVFSKNGITQKINEKMSEYRHILEKHLHSKEVKSQVTLEELLSKYNITESDLQEKGLNASEFSIEELEEKIKEVFGQESGTEGQQETSQDNEGVSTEMSQDGEDNEGNEINDEVNTSPSFETQNSNESDGEVVEEKFTLKFELSHEDIRRKIYEQIDAHMEAKGFGNDWYFIVSVYETYLIAGNAEGDRFFKVAYEKQGDEIVLGDVIEVFPMFLTAEEKGALELMRNNFEALQKENDELKQFKANVLKAEHEAKAEELFSQFSKLDEEDIADLRENVHNFTIEELESKLYERLGRKMAKFSNKQKENVNILKVSQIIQDTRPSGYRHLFEKHGVTFKTN